MYGPNGICEDIVLEFFNKLGITLSKAITDDKNKINGIAIHPNQKPIADNNLASPNPIPSLFLKILYTKIITQIIPYPIIPPIKELI
jgi:hypothetical protein